MDPIKPISSMASGKVCKLSGSQGGPKRTRPYTQVPPYSRLLFHGESLKVIIELLKIANGTSDNLFKFDPRRAKYFTNEQLFNLMDRKVHGTRPFCGF